MKSEQRSFMESYKAWVKKQVGELHRSSRQSNGSQVSKRWGMEQFQSFSVPRWGVPSLPLPLRAKSHLLTQQHFFFFSANTLHLPIRDSVHNRAGHRISSLQMQLQRQEKNWTGNWVFSSLSSPWCQGSWAFCLTSNPCQPDQQANISVYK